LVRNILDQIIIPKMIHICAYICVRAPGISGIYMPSCPPCAESVSLRSQCELLIAHNLLFFLLHYITKDICLGPVSWGVYKFIYSCLLESWIHSLSFLRYQAHASILLLQWENMSKASAFFWIGLVRTKKGSVKRNWVY